MNISKRWPESHFSELAGLFVKNNFNVCLIGGAKDKEIGDFIVSQNENTIHNFIGMFSLRQSAELLRRSKLLISNDSAPTHLASALNIPTVTLFGSTVPEFGFGPVAEKNRIMQIDLECRPCTDHGRNKCPIKTLACLKDISPQEVFDSAIKLFK